MVPGRQSLRIKRQTDSRGRTTYTVRQSRSGSEVLDRVRPNQDNRGQNDAGRNNNRNYSEERKEEREEKEFQVGSGSRRHQASRGDNRPIERGSRKYRSRSRDRHKYRKRSHRNERVNRSRSKNRVHSHRYYRRRSPRREERVRRRRVRSPRPRSVPRREHRQFRRREYSMGGKDKRRNRADENREENPFMGERRTEQQQIQPEGGSSNRLQETYNFPTDPQASLHGP